MLAIAQSGVEHSFPGIALAHLDSPNGSQAFSLPVLSGVETYHNNLYICFFETTHSIVFEAGRGAVPAAPIALPPIVILDHG